MIEDVDDYIFKNLMGESDGWQTRYDFTEVKNAMLDFAKKHVRQALIDAAKLANTITEETYIERKGEYEYYQVIDRQSILDAYPEENIK